jgi:ribosome-associated protein
MKNEPESLLNTIGQTLFDKKGFNILALDVKGISTLTDYFVIAEGNVDRHVIALAKEIVKKLKEQEIYPSHIEGLEQGDWIVVDYMEIVVHIFKPGFREKYRLEELWNDGKIVDLKFNVVKTS